MHMIQPRLKSVGLLCVALLAGCGSTPELDLQPLQAIVPSLNVQSVWVKEVGERSIRHHRQLPVILSDQHIIVSDAEGRLASYQQQNGELIWKRKLKDNITSGPSVVEDKLILATANAELIALNKASGDLVWRSKTSSEVLSAPAYADGKLFVQSIDGKLSAINMSDGVRNWIANHEVPPLSLRGTASPLVVENKVIAGFASGKLIAFDIAKGNVVWERAVTTPKGRTDLERMVDIDGLFQVHNNTLYVTTYQGRIAALSVSDGGIIWTRDMSSFTGLVIEDKQIYISDSEDRVWALDRNTGATIWRQDSLLGRRITRPVLMRESVVVADVEGNVHWLSKIDGGFLAREKVNDVYKAKFYDLDDNFDERVTTISATPLVSDDNLLFIRDDEGAITVYTVAAKSK